MLFKVIFTVCYLNSPALCEEVTMTGDGDLRLPYTCMIGSELALANWNNTYNKDNKWYVKVIDCEEQDNAVKGYFANGR